MNDLAIIAITVFATAVVMIIARNFISGEKKIKQKVTRLYDIADPLFERTMSQLLGPPFVDGNAVTPLENGIEIFPPILAAIASAKRSVTFETFIFKSGRVADTFADAFAACAIRGVKVHVLLDGVGCDCVNGREIKLMRDAGIQVKIYHQSKFFRFNHRTHRKLLVIDGTLAFTGGLGIADEWEGNAQSPENWRDTHYSVEGPVVAQLQAAFLGNWMKVSGEVLLGEDYFPPLEKVGELRCQMFKSSPMEGSESARLMYLLSITGAEHSIKVGNAYFLPDDLISAALIAAVERGVVVEILLPGPHLDSNLVRAASRHRRGHLLKHGVKIFVYEPTMYHCKLMIIDGLLISVGSANFDNRSFRLNDEANLNIIDAEFVAVETRTFEADKANARELTYDDWLARPLRQKITDAMISLLRSQL